MAEQDPNNNPNKSPFSQPQDTKLFYGGADTDTSRELLGSDKKGKFIDALNTRISDEQDGKGLAARTIRGEENLYDTNINGTTYRCIGSMNVADYLVEFFAPFNPVDGGIIRINGVVMCRSVDFAITPNHPLEWDVNNDELGGEVFITDFNLKPLYFSIKDIIDNFTGLTQKYFADFNLNNYVITLFLPQDNIVYDRNPLITVGAGGGLPTGQYGYSHRYITTSGEASNMSVMTPLIYVPEFIQGLNTNEPYAGNKNIGNDPDTQTPGNYGVVLNFRVNNYNNYDFIEIIRTSYNGGEGIDFTPQSFIVKRIPISAGQFQIMQYIDSTANQSDELVLIGDEQRAFISEIKRAKAIRYFYNKVILGNIEYESRDVTGQITFLTSPNGNTMAPIIKNIGQLGYKDAYNHAYFRGLMTGERYGWGIAAWDNVFNRSLVVPITGFTNYLMPNKRDVLTTWLGGDSDLYTKDTPSIQSTVNGTVDKTFELVDYKLGTKRVPITGENQLSGRNILNRGNIETLKSGVKAGDVGYRPFTPTKPYDFNSNEQYTPVEKCGDGGIGMPATPAPGNDVTYDPHMFNPEYNALGMALVGIDQLPSWATAFSVVRTKRAGRVIAQGMGFWQMNDSIIWNQGGQKGTGTLRRRKLAVHFPDAENGVVPSSLIDELKNNPTAFQVQFVEPLGFTSEVFHFRSSIHANPILIGSTLGTYHCDSQVDMVVHAKVQAEIVGKRIVDGQPATEVGIVDGTDGYVAFGIWRNQSTPLTVGGQPFVSNGNRIWQLASVALDTNNEENKTFLILEFTEDCYNAGEGFGWNNNEQDFNYSTTKQFQQPVYVINLIRDGVSVQNLDFQSFLSTGQYVKVRSVVGISNGLSGQQLNLCGERNEDCGKLATDTLDRYIWVESDNNGTFLRWINISYLSAPDIATINLDIANGTTNYNGLRLYGTYECQDDGTGVFIIKFTNPAHTPINLAKIEVRYDNRFPVYVFGGDTFIGQANFPVVHRSTQTEKGSGEDAGFNNGWGNMLRWNRGMPYRWWKLKENYYIVRHTRPPGINWASRIQGADGLNPLYGVDWCKIGAVRQMVVLYNCQSYSHLPLAYKEFYPVVNYKMRPCAWDGSKSVHDNHLFDQYETDYPTEKDRWQLGGLAIEQFKDVLNLDYSKENISELYQFVSQIQLLNNTYFPTRIAWSQTRPIQFVLAPNLKTFGPFSIFDISSNRGQIQRLFNFSRGGENLYAGCEDDWCMVMTRKRTLSDLTGNALGVTGNGQDTAFIQEQIWQNETKKGALKGDFYLTFADNGNEAFYANYSGVYKMTEGSGGRMLLQDITNGYKNQLYKSLFTRVDKEGVALLTQRLNAVYNNSNGEYWLGFKTTIPEKLLNVAIHMPYDMFDTVSGVSTPHTQITKTLAGSHIRLTNAGAKIIKVLFKITSSVGAVNFYNPADMLMFVASDGEWWEVTYNPYSVNTFTFKKVDKELNDQRDTFLFSYKNGEEGSGFWNGVFDYDYDQYASWDKNIIGTRSETSHLISNNLGAGFRINGANINGRIFSTLNPQLFKSYNFNRFRINSNILPTSIKFYNVDDMSVAISSVADTLMKDYHGYENLIPRDSAKNRNSDTHILFQILSQLADKDFFINSITFQYIQIK